MRSEVTARDLANLSRWDFKASSARALQNFCMRVADSMLFDQ